MQTIVTVAILVEEAKKVTFGAPLVVYTPHSVRIILQQKADKWLTDARLLKYEAILIHCCDLELQTTSAQNLAQFLFGEVSGVPIHDCAEVMELQTKIRPDLEEEELEEKWGKMVCEWISESHRWEKEIRICSSEWQNRGSSRIRTLECWVVSTSL